MSATASLASLFIDASASFNSNGFTLTVGGDITGNGTLTAGASAINVGGDMTVSNFTAGTSTVTFNGSVAQAIGGSYTFNNLSTSTGGTKTLGGSTTVTGVLTVGASTTLDGSTQTLTLSGGGTPLVINGTFTPSTSTVNYTNAGATNIAAANYYNLDGTGGNRTLPSSGTVGIANTFTVGAGTYTVAGSTVSFNGSGDQSIPVFPYDNLQTATGGTKTLAGTTTVSTVLTVGASSTLDLGSQTLNLPGAGTPLVISGTFTPTASTVIYNNSGGAQSITGTTYNNLQTANSGTKSLLGTTTVNSVLTVGASSTLNLGSQTLNLAGSGTPLVVNGTFTPSTSTVVYNSGGAQNITATTYNNLQTATGGTKTLAATTTTVNSVLTVGTSTTLDLGAQTLILAGGGTPLVINGTGAVTPTTSTVQYSNAGLTTIAAANYYNLDGTGGNRTLASAGTIGIANVFTVGAGTYTVTGSTVSFNGSGSQNIPAFTFDNLQTATGGTKTLAGTTTVNSVLTVGASSALDLSTRTLNLAGNGTPLVVNGTFTPSTSTVVYNSGGAQNITATTYNNLQTATGGTKTLAGATTVNSVLTVGASSTLDLSSRTLNLAGNGTPLVNNGTFTPSTSTVVYSSGGAQNVTALTYNNLQTATGGTKTLVGTTTVNGVLTVGASTTLDLSTRTLNLAGNGTPLVVSGTFTPSTSTVLYNSGGAQNIAATTYNNLQTATGGTKTLAATTTTVNSVLTVGASSTLDLSSQTLTLAGSGTPLVITGTFIATSSTSTVNYTSTSSTNITAANYYNLNGSGGNRTLPNAATVGIAGDFTPGSGTYTITGSTVSFNGTGAQNNNGAFTFTNLTLAKSAGALTLASGDITVNSTLTLTSGNISAGSNTVIIPAGGTVSRTSGHVIGNLRKNVAVSGGAVSRTFEVGDASAYAPVTIDFSSVSVAGNLTVKATAGVHPDLGNSGLDPRQAPTRQSVNRTWTASNSGVVFGAGTYNVTLNYAAGDLDAGLDLTAVDIAKADSCAPSCVWTFPPPTSTVTATSAKATGFTSFSDFGVGHRIDHFVFSAPGTATPGTPFPVTITAVDKNGSTVNGFTGTATVTSASGNCTISAGGTTGSFISGVFTGNVTISNVCSDTLKATQVGNSGVTGTSGSVSVAPTVASFNVFETTTAANATTGQIYTKISGTGFDLAVVALNSTPAQVSFAGNVKLELLSGTTFANCPGSGNTPLQTINSFAISGGRMSTTAGAFNVANAYGDVRVRVTCDSTNCPPSGITSCSTDNFSIRPGAFAVTSTNAGNTGTSGAPAIKAGANFNLTADSGNSNYSGTPVFDATKVVVPGGFVAGTFTGSFTAAVAGVTPGVNGVAAGSSFTYSEVGNFGFKADAVVDSSFTSVDQTNDCNAGSTSNSIDGAGKYGCNIGSAAVASGTGLGFGRFIPDHFALTAAGAMTQGCNAGGFSYLGQAMQFSAITLEARNSAGAKTSNYAGVYAKLDPTANAAAFNLAARDTGTGTDLTTRINGSISGSWTTGALSLSVGSLTITRNATPDGPYAATKIGIAPVDPVDPSVTLQASDLNIDVDGDSTNDHARIGSGDTSWRFGRLRILPATGITSLPLNVPVRAEYWNGSGFVTNTADSCTQLARANVKQSAYQAPLAACDTIISTTPVTLSAGVGTLQLTATTPTGDHTGSVTLTPQLAGPPGTYCNVAGGGTTATSPAGLSYLQGKWNNSANYDQDPSARAAFGVYGSQPRNFIFFRENY